MFNIFKNWLDGPRTFLARDIFEVVDFGVNSNSLDTVF